ncbi:MAG: ABC transporter permease [Desulfobulbaceae bacterium BRH_c16a]|nr:MAG: ABC transporter permease [Desulfobulbaceae bacterium BRH_c16a]
MKTIFRIARKEFDAFFSSPIALIFIGVFLAVTLFVFFWVETFFANNITEVRPLFRWMPILLIFLTSAVTMRLWAEERRSGTLEFLLTSPVPPPSLVFGKFLACLGLIAVSLLLTLPLPVTVSLMGPLDWGPVFGGYLATLFLAAAYIAIGLFISAKSENQIVSLIITVLVCSVFYLIGSETLASFFGNRGSELLQLLGSGSRFNSITRGVIDLRDLYYYLSIMGIFLSLNIYGLERIRWADNPANSRHRRWQLVCGLVIANFLVANFWMAPIGVLRADMTKGNIYSISESTRNYLGQLKEPLLLRGYFSSQTHPLLAPLVPRIRDLLQEFAVAGGGNVRVEFIDPLEHPDLEQEAGQKYGIRPVPFQTASKYQAAVTNSYFDILIQYGDQFETLGFRDLIELKSTSETDLDVELRNPEYDITRAIKKVLYSYQSGGDLFAGIGKEIQFTGYMSPDQNLPEELVSLKKELQTILAEMETEGGKLFSSRFLDPDAEKGAVAEKISKEYGFRPMAASLFDQRSFWYYMTLTSGEQVVEIPLPEDLAKESLKRAIEAGLKRFGAGFSKTVALHTPKAMPPMPQFGMPGSGLQFDILKDVLGKEHRVVPTDLATGRVPEEADLLMVVAPENVDEKQLFAIDQFLMQGGTVVIASSPFSVGLERELSIEKKKSGLEEWLRFQGLTIGEEMVLDPQNSAFPVPVQRQVAGFTVQETKLVNYPYFVDIRPDSMDQDSGLMTGLTQLTLNWASPITVDVNKNLNKMVVQLLKSSIKSWVSADTKIQPNFRAYGEAGFAAGEASGKQLLGVAIEGNFTSYFSGKQSPLLAESQQPAGDKQPVEKKPGMNKKPGEDKEPDEEKAKQIIARQLDKSPESARIILFSSNTFLSDIILGIGSSVMRTDNLGPVQLMANSVDWALEDRGLLAIRGRSHFARPLLPITKDMHLVFEYVNYGLAMLGLIIIWLIRKQIGKITKQRQLALLRQSIGRI